MRSSHPGDRARGGCPRCGSGAALRSGNALVRDHQDEALRLADAGPARPTRRAHRHAPICAHRSVTGRGDVAILNFSRGIHDDLGSLSIRGERR